MLSDACFEFLNSVEAAAAILAKAVHHYADPEGPFDYGSEIDALRKACAAVHASPFDPDAGATLLRLASSVMRFHDTSPGTELVASREQDMRRLIRLIQADSGEETASIAAVVRHVVTETEPSPSEVNNLKALLSKLGRSSYDAAIKIITDIGSAALKHMLGL